MSKYIFVVVGVGGTGSLLARDLPKLCIDKKHRMVLIDGDIVELSNCKRQGYQKQDIDTNKAVALSRKINSLYAMNCLCIDRYVETGLLQTFLESYIKRGFTPVIIGCVDNDATRKILETDFKSFHNAIYIDSANSEYKGNVYITKMFYGKQFGKLRSEVYDLELDNHPRDASCQQQAAIGNVQFLVTNVKMATCVLEHCSNILETKNNKIQEEGVQIVERFNTVFYN